MIKPFNIVRDLENKKFTTGSDVIILTQFDNGIFIDFEIWLIPTAISPALPEKSTNFFAKPKSNPENLEMPSAIKSTAAFHKLPTAFSIGVLFWSIESAIVLITPTTAGITYPAAFSINTPRAVITSPAILRTPSIKFSELSPIAYTIADNVNTTLAANLAL